jgi:putative peptidoglycan binding protein/KAP-like P-loop domain-containing protein
MQSAPTLKIGSRGEDVRRVQEALSALGYRAGPVDGNYGPGTREAVQAFQVLNNLPATGEVDLLTSEALFSSGGAESNDRSDPVGSRVGVSQAVDNTGKDGDPPRQLVTRRAGTTIWVSSHPRPWELPCDALVIPVSAHGKVGSLAVAFHEYLGATHRDLADQFAKKVLSQSTLMTPADPIGLPPLADQVTAGVPRHLILATAESSDRFAKGPGAWSVAAAGVAANMVVRQADRSQAERLVLPLLGSGEAGLPPSEVATEMLRSVLAALPAEHVRDITLVTLNADAVRTLAAVESVRSQTLANDLPAGNDLLDVEREVAALAEAILLREMAPPLVVGILGGWGSGKSFVMHLMRERISEIRALAIDDPNAAWTADKERLFPYVGHPYVITFDAWTYANADLWASLMQTVFDELSRQLTLEARLQAAGVEPLAGGEVWRALTLLNEPERLAVLTAATNNLEAELLRAGPRDAALSDVLWKRMQDLKKDQLQELEATRGRRSHLREKLEQANARVTQAAAAEVDRLARQEAWRRLAGGVLASVLRTVGKKSPELGEALRDAPGDLHVLADQVGFFQQLGHAPRGEVALFLAVAASVLLVPLVDQRLVEFRVPGALTAMVTTLLGWRRVAVHWQGWLDGVRREQETLQREARARLAGQQDVIKNRMLAEQQSALDEALARETDPDAKHAVVLLDEDNVPALQRELHRVEAVEAAFVARIGTPAGFLSLAEFVKARLGGGEYQSKLGLMHQVQRDIASLSDCLLVYDQDLHGEEKRRFFPRGPARVVLFIDDLDRCPPEQVVAVLEAVQLLVKTRLFVVVLGMDVRYVTRALEKRYEGILWRRGEPSGLDYIEKIVQIPYRVRPIDPLAFAGFVGSQMRVAAAGPAGGGAAPMLGGVPAPGPAGPTPTEGTAAGAIPALPRKVLEFSQEERAMVSASCSAIGLSPRSVKRVVNVCKLLKIIWHRGEGHAEPEVSVERALVMLLALAAQYPEAMRYLLDDLSEACQRGERARLGTWLAARARQHAAAPLAGTHWADLQTALRTQRDTLGAVSVGALHLAECNLVRSFSFLGDIGTSPEEFGHDGAPAFRSRRARRRPATGADQTVT